MQIIRMLTLYMHGIGINYKYVPLSVYAASPCLTILPKSPRQTKPVDLHNRESRWQDSHPWPLGSDNDLNNDLDQQAIPPPPVHSPHVQKKDSIKTTEFAISLKEGVSVKNFLKMFTLWPPPPSLWAKRYVHNCNCCYRSVFWRPENSFDMKTLTNS